MAKAMKPMASKTSSWDAEPFIFGHVGEHAIVRFAIR